MNNRPNNNKRKSKGSMYFDPLINQFNGDIFKAPQNILISKLKKLVIDMIRGNVSYEKYGKYFSPEFIYYLAEYVTLKYNEALYLQDMSYHYKNLHPDSSYAQQKAAVYQNQLNAWQIIKTNTDYLHATGDVQTVLTRIPNQMRDNYKNTIKIDD